MAVKLSTGLAASMLGNYGLKAMMNYGWIAVYDGTQPISPDMPSASNLLGRVTTGGNPVIVGSTSGGALRLTQDESGTILKSGTWTLTGEENGTAIWWRWWWNAYDDGSYSMYYPRLDGLVGESLILANNAITTSTSIEIEAFNVQFRSG